MAHYELADKEGMERLRASDGLAILFAATGESYTDCSIESFDTEVGVHCDSLFVRPRAVPGDRLWPRRPRWQWRGILRRRWLSGNTSGDCGQFTERRRCRCVRSD